MAKLKANAEAIRLEIKRRIEASAELDGDCKDCGAPTPCFTDPAFNNGCNWTVDVFPGVIPGCFDFVTHIAQSVMADYDLIE